MLNMKIGTWLAYVTPDKLFTGETAMEVKDINNQNNLLAIFKKNSGEVSALDFSSLIAGKNRISARHQLAWIWTGHRAFPKSLP